MTKPLMRFMVGASSAEIIAAILRVLFPDARTALDLTPGHGCFWSETVPTHVSVQLSEHDFTALPYADAISDVALIDPPHLADAGQRSIMRQRFGTYPSGELEDVVRQGVREAFRVATLGCVVKVCDHIHERRLQHMSGWVSQELGTPYDEVHQVRARSLVDPKWHEPQLSARNNGSTYLIFRKGEQRHLRRAG